MARSKRATCAVTSDFLEDAPSFNRHFDPEDGRLLPRLSLQLTLEAPRSLSLELTAADAAPSDSCVRRPRAAGARFRQPA
eukprot:574444-Hanusia_phi.AAC.1